MRVNITRGPLGFLIKIIILVIIIGILALVFLQCGGMGCVTKIDRSLPSVAKAPFQVETPTHLYFAAIAVKDKSNDVQMTDWWEEISGSWVYHEVTIVLPSRIYGDKMNVSKR